MRLNPSPAMARRRRSLVQLLTRAATRGGSAGEERSLPRLTDILLALPDRDGGSKPADFLAYYEADLGSRRLEPLIVVEVGVYRGHFLATLEKWMPNARFIGIDVRDFRTLPLQRTSFHICDQADAAGVTHILRNHAPDGVDVIIDDASHHGAASLALYRAAFPFLRRGGAYFIEDWGTGYWPNWVDGAAYQPPVIDGPRMRSHDAGMVGFIKVLVDDSTAAIRDPPGAHTIDSMMIRPGLVRLDRTRIEE
jgi:hypothetical protein